MILGVTLGLPSPLWTCFLGKTVTVWEQLALQPGDLTPPSVLQTLLGEDRAGEQCKDGQNAVCFHSSLKGVESLGGKSHQGQIVVTWPRRTLATCLPVQNSFFLETLGEKDLRLGVLPWSGRSSDRHGTRVFLKPPVAGEWVRTLDGCLFLRAHTHTHA